MKNIIRFSIIIPTYNEENYLPSLLNSISKQNIEPTEIIIADNNSSDQTREIAKSYNCKVTQGGKSPGSGRNEGSKIATTDIFVFFDADARIDSDNFFKKVLSDFCSKQYDFA